MRESKQYSFDLVPESLKRSGSFCLWKYEPDRNGRITKVSYSVKGYKTNSAKKTSYSYWHLVLGSLDAYAGIGLGVFDGLSMIDIDHCVFEDGSLSEMAKDIVHTMDSYTEISPSGTGLGLSFMRMLQIMTRIVFISTTSQRGSKSMWRVSRGNTVP